MKLLTDEEIDKIRIIVASGDTAEGLFNKSMKAACQAQLEADLKDLQTEREKIGEQINELIIRFKASGNVKMLIERLRDLKQEIIGGEL
jgi:hypothetical protein